MEVNGVRSNQSTLENSEATDGIEPPSPDLRVTARTGPLHPASRRVGVIVNSGKILGSLTTIFAVTIPESRNAIASSVVANHRGSKFRV
jgi:hypothetical protein